MEGDGDREADDDWTAGRAKFSSLTVNSE